LLYHLEESLLFPNPKVKGTSGVSKLSATALGVPITIECKQDKIAGELGSGGSSTNTVITYEKCVLGGAAEEDCKVEKTLTTNKLKDQLTSSGRIEDTFEPETGTKFITIAISHTTGHECSIEGSYPITGSQKCEVDTSNSVAETLQAAHEVICDTSGSSLKLGGNAATYQGTAKINLDSPGGNWATE